MSEKELELLKSSIATLKPGISYDEINESLSTIKGMADKAAAMPPPQTGAPASTGMSAKTPALKIGDVLRGYRYLGGPRSKPDSWEKAE